MKQRPKESLLHPEDVRVWIKELAKQKQELKARIDDLNKKIMDIKLLCPHVATDHYPDASGNNDDTTVCRDCGGSW